MSRPPNIIPGVKVHVHIPEDLKLKVDLLLYSASEHRVPHGAYSRFFTDLVRQYLTQLEGFRHE